MRFQLTEDYWALDALSPAEWHLVAELPGTAAGENFSEETRARLYPSPLSPDSLADEETLSSIDDWNEFVQPEIESTFRNAREIVEKDLEKVEFVSMEEFFSPEQYELIKADLPELRRVTIRLENTEAWYSTLNQARLLMNEEYDLASSEERLMLRLEHQENIDQERLLIFAQYELYSAVQGMLVENVMGLS
ncbi:MAG: hypothetical protein P1U81_07510 [Verrucomicrobiales bacterium]|jgi:hypothetical protein|nr:hypothetical protein [bacterium]MDF2376073.1 hypothetical protein [Verrucomicrobiales bacterium]